MRNTDTEKLFFYLKFKFNGASMFYLAALFSEINAPQKESHKCYWAPILSKGLSLPHFPQASLAQKSAV